MHKSRLGTIIIDCQTDDLKSHADFWGAALGSTPEPDNTPVNPKYIRLDGPPEEVQVLLQKVDHPSRIHLDIETDDIEAEVSRLEQLGAKVIERLQRWVVMEAPSGHRFCVIGPIRSDFKAHATNWN